MTTTLDPLQVRRRELEAQLAEWDEVIALVNAGGTNAWLREEERVQPVVSKWVKDPTAPEGWCWHTFRLDDTGKLQSTRRVLRARAFTQVEGEPPQFVDPTPDHEQDWLYDTEAEALAGAVAFCAYKIEWWTERQARVQDRLAEIGVQ